ncbi:unnamed protein product [Agarophyton chilense]
MLTVSIILLMAAFLLTALNTWVNLRQPEPYMDELFHIPQAQEFCNALASKRLPLYDPSITTPPALYIPNAILAALSGNKVVCDTRWLRVTSATMSFFSLLLMVNILQITTRIRRGHYGSITAGNALVDDEVVWLLSFIIWLHPVNLFYSNLFYTDTTSLFWVLLFWRINLRNSSLFSAPFGVLGSLSRQTNMVWHAYLSLDTYVNSNIPQSDSDIPLFVLNFIRGNRFHVLAGIGYIAFVVLNKGIVLGDKSHHEMTMHHAMFAYFAAFQGSFFTLIQLSMPWEALKMVYTVFSSGRLTTFLLSVCVALTAMVLATGDAVHPFILADNRHFTFYIYRRWLLRSIWRRLALVPIYGWCLTNSFFEPIIVLSIERQGSIHSLNESHCDQWTSKAEFFSDVALLACAYITLVPSSLLEPRYFVVGSTLFWLRRAARLGSSPNKIFLVLVSVGMLFLNVAFVYIFAELPFPRAIDLHMPNDTSPGRFMF